LTSFIIILIPGPSVLFTVSRAIVLGRLAGVAVAPDRAERLLLGTFHLGRVSAAPALQIEVLSYRVVK